MSPEPVFKNVGQQMSGPDSSSGKSIPHDPKVGGSIPPQVEIFVVSKSSTLSQEHLFVSLECMLSPAHS